MSQSSHTYRTVGKQEDEDADPMVEQLKECSKAYTELEASISFQNRMSTTNHMLCPNDMIARVKFQDSNGISNLLTALSYEPSLRLVQETVAVS